MSNLRHHMKYQYSREKLQKMIEAVLFNDRDDRQAIKDLKTFLPYINGDSMADLYAICCELEAKYIMKLTQLESDYSVASLDARRRLKPSISLLKDRLALADQLSQIIKPQTDHSIRGVIHRFEKILGIS